MRPPSTSRRALAVEDNPETRETLLLALRVWVHQPEVAGDGEEGLTIALAWRLEVVLVYIGLPLLDGYEVARQVSAAVRDQVNRIALTGYGSAEHREWAFASGFDHYLTKPADPEELRRLLAAEQSHGRPPRRGGVRASLAEIAVTCGIQGPDRRSPTRVAKGNRATWPFAAP
jgi:CheY-like chemotaxis protein